MDPSDPPPGRHRAVPGPGHPAAARTGSRDRPPAPPAHRGPLAAAHRGPEPPAAHRGPEPSAAVDELPAGSPHTPGTDSAARATALARFLAVAREQASPTPAPATRRRPRGRVLAAGGLVLGVTAVLVGLHTTARAAPEPLRPAGTPASPARPAATTDRPASSVPASDLPATSDPATGPATTGPRTTALPTTRPPTAGPATAAARPTPTGSRPPLQVRDVPVVPVPPTAVAPTRAAPATPVPPSAAAGGRVAWRSVVRQLFATRSAAFAAGRPELLGDSDAPESALLTADRALFDQAVRRAGFTRVGGLTFDLEGIRLLAVGPRDAQVEVSGRQGGYVLLGPGRSRAVPAGPRRVLTLQLTRSSTTAAWLLAAGSVHPAS